MKIPQPIRFQMTKLFNFEIKKEMIREISFSADYQHKLARSQVNGKRSNKEHGRVKQGPGRGSVRN